MSDYIIRNVTKLANEINGEINSDKRRSIGEVAKELGVEAHVIRFWESKFEQIKPEIGRGKRRYYRKKDIEILRKIKTSLYDQGYTIAGLQKLIKNKQNRHQQKPDIDSALLNIAKTFSKKNKSLFDENDYNVTNQGQLQMTIEDFINQDQEIETDYNNISLYKEEILSITANIQNNLTKLKSFCGI